MKLKDYLKELYHCFHCHLCNVGNWHELDEWVSICPTYAYFGFESFSAAGKIEIGRAFIQGKIKKPSSRMLQIIFGDLGCGACHSQCKDLTGLNIDHVEFFEELKTKLVEEGYGPLPKQADYARSIQRNHNPYWEKHEKRTSWLNSRIPKGGKIVYFVGCTSSYRTQEIARATVEILSASGVEFGIMDGEEWCCGSPLLRTGQRKLARDLAKHNLRALKDAGAEKVIFSCAGCYKTFKKDYPKLLGRTLDFEVLHTSEYFWNLIKEKKLRPRREEGIKVTYHDPCHLGRGTGLYDPPRQVLREIFGRYFVEMKRTKENAWCCGAGSGVKAALPDFAIWSATQRLEEAEKTGANILASTCPFCKRNLEDAEKKVKKGMEVRDLSELLSERLT